MPSSNMVPNQSPQSPKKRSRWEKFLVRGLISVLGLFALTEGMSSFGYSRTLKNLEARRASEREAGKSTRLDDLQTIGSGWYSRTELAHPHARIVELRWPSLVKQYVLQLHINKSNDDIMDHMTGTDLVESLTAVNPTSHGDPLQTKVIPTGGLGLEKIGSNPVLLRELNRQAILMAAREHFGLVTRDDTLQETWLTQAEGENWPFEVEVRFQSQDRFVVGLYRQAPRQRHTYFEKTISISHDTMFIDVSRQAEGWSGEEFVAAFKAAGFTPIDVPAPQVDGQLSDEVHQWTASPNPILQCLALRRLHQQVCDEGESLAVRTAIARSYALLGSLTELHWGVGHKAFKARAMLCADRAVRLWPDDADSYWTRAFVRALVGLHQPGLEDIAQAKGMSETTPEWGAALEAFCSWNTEQLKSLADSDTWLSQYFYLLATEMLESPAERTQIAQKLWQRDPTCFRAAATMAYEMDLGTRHLTNAAGLAGIQSAIPDLFSQASDLPAAAQSPLQELRSASVPLDKPMRRLLAGQKWDESQTTLTSLIEALRQADQTTLDRQEPSWQIVGALLHDEIFLQAVSQLYFQRFMLGVETQETLIKLERLLVHHPLAKVLGGFDTDLVKARTVIAENRSLMDQHELSEGSRVLWSLGHVDSAANYIGEQIRAQREVLVPELIEQLRHIRQQQMKNNSVMKAPKEVEQLARLAPGCPIVAAERVESDWKTIAPKAREWEERYASAPEVIAKLAQKYESSNQLEDAERCYRRLIKLNPEAKNYWPLVSLYTARDDWEQLQKILREVVELPSTGLESAQAASKLAYGYMDRRDWDQAKPFADLAARSYSQWGLTCAAEYYEGIREWKTAESMHRAAAERYESGQGNWYLWCRRTGQGDVDNARSLAEQYVTRHTAESPDDGELLKSIMLQLDDHPETAYGILEKLADNKTDSYRQILAAFLAHQLNKIPERDKWLALVAKADDDECAPYLARRLRRFFIGNQALPDDEELDWCWSLELGDGKPTNNAYFIAKCLQMMGDEQRAVGWLTTCATSPSRNNFSTTLAGAELLKLGKDPPLRRSTEFDAARRKAVGLTLSAYKAYKEREPNPSLEKYREAVAASPDWFFLHYPIAMAYRNGSNWEAANRELTTLIEKLPAIPEFYSLRALGRERLGDPEGAIQDYEAALAIDPSHENTHNNLGWVLAASPENDIRNGKLALEHAEAARSRHPNRVWIEFGLLAAAHAELGDFEKAVSLQETAAAKASIDNRGNVDRILRLYRAKQPYRRPPPTLPLISTLPPDGSWARYVLKGKVEQVPQKVAVTIRSVGSFKIEDRELRAIELELEGGDGPLSPVTYRFLVPVAVFGRGRHALAQSAKIWERRGDEDARTIENLDTEPYLAYVLAGADEGLIFDNQRQPIDWKGQTLNCEKFFGYSRASFGDQRWNGNWRVLRHPEAWFGAASVDLRISINGQESANLTMALDSQGDGAQPKLAQLQQ